MWPNTKYYTSNDLDVLGKHVESKRWGYHYNSGSSETFLLDTTGEKREITYDYEGNTCFVAVDF